VTLGACAGEREIVEPERGEVPLELRRIRWRIAERVTDAALDGAGERVPRHTPLFRARDTMQPLGRRRIEPPGWRHLGHYAGTFWSAV
jgi:hypothetical protein